MTGWLAAGRARHRCGGGRRLGGAGAASAAAASARMEQLVCTVRVLTAWLAPRAWIGVRIGRAGSDLPDLSSGAEALEWRPAIVAKKVAATVSPKTKSF